MSRHRIMISEIIKVERERQIRIFGTKVLNVWINWNLQSITYDTGKVLWRAKISWQNFTSPTPPCILHCLKKTTMRQLNNILLCYCYSNFSCLSIARKALISLAAKAQNEYYRSFFGVSSWIFFHRWLCFISKNSCWNQCALLLHRNCR